MKQAIKNHIEKIRQSDERTQRWWVIIASTIVMCIIIVLWIMYISATLPQIGTTVSVDKKTTQTTSTTHTSMWNTFVAGIKITFQGVQNSFHSIGTIFSENMKSMQNIQSKKKETQQTSSETPFIPNDPGPLESVPLQ